MEKERDSYFEGWRTAPDPEMREYFYKKITSIKESIAEVQKELFEFDTDVKDGNQIKEQLQEIKEQLKSLQHIETLDKCIVDNFVDKIIVNQDGSLYLTLKAGTKFTTTVPEYSEVAASIRKGEAVQYIKSLKDFFYFWQSVGRLFIGHTMDHLARVMRILQEICLCVWKPWY